MDLQNTFYIVGIIFMGLMLLLFVALVVAVFAIRARINAIHKDFAKKIAAVSGLGGTVAEAGKQAVRTVRRAVKR